MHEQERKWYLQKRAQLQAYLNYEEQGYYDRWKPEQRRASIRGALTSIFAISRSLGDFPDLGSTGERSTP